jgi:hypothetical protein
MNTALISNKLWINKVMKTNKKMVLMKVHQFNNNRKYFKDLQIVIINTIPQWIKIKGNNHHQISIILSYLLQIIEEIKAKIIVWMEMLILDFTRVNSQEIKTLFNIILTITLWVIIKHLMMSKMTLTLEVIAQVFLSFLWAAIQEEKSEKFPEENINDMNPFIFQN